MNFTTLSVFIFLFSVAVIGVFAQAIKFKSVNVENVQKAQTVTVEYKLEEKNFTDETYGNLHREILNALNGKKTTATSEQQTTQQTTEQTTKTTIETTEQTTTTGPTTATIDQRRGDERRRRSSSSDEIVYKDEDVFFYDLENYKIKNGVIRVSVGLHKEGYEIREDLLYDTLMKMNKTGELGSSVGLKVVRIYRGFPDGYSPSTSSPMMDTGSMVRILIVAAVGFLLKHLRL